ncbi:MAG TPA: hypothetical protein PK347_14900 [Burkholderiaceae bacterium]|nr:hypothetical protein [Burkholderiaceae bacterium]
MPVTLFLARLAVVLFLLLLFTQAQAVATALVWLLIAGFFVMIAEALNLLNWLAGELFGRVPPKD